MEPCKRGHAANERYSPREGRNLGACRVCISEKAGERLPAVRKAQRVKYRSVESNQRKNYRSSLIGCCTFLIAHAKSSSKSKGYPEPTITREWILEQIGLQNGCCFYNRKWTLDPSGSTSRGYRPSLDRIDNNLYYTPDNTRVTSLFWNYMRNTMSIEDTLKALS